ncbi:MAG: hypothetical protein IKC71_00525 [Clostridia bacterium]|nr:hypothetical protein [Clostridia bacterium]
MDEARKKRLVVSGTITGVLLIVILVFVMVFQLVSIGVEKKRSAELDSTIAELEVLNKDIEQGIKDHSERWWIEQRARELGYLYKNDHKLN